jgi:hypothetical protein
MIETMHHNIKMWYARRNVYKQTHKELSTLNQRELNDLGLNSDMINEVAYEAAYGRK